MFGPDKDEDEGSNDKDEDEGFCVIPLKHNFRNSPGVLTFVHKLESILKEEKGDKIR
jgi:hypothetical protein